MSTIPCELADYLLARLRQNLLAVSQAAGFRTQKQLAKAAEVSEQSLSGFLSGKRGLSVKTIDALIDAIGIDVAELFAKFPPDPRRHTSAVEQAGQGGPRGQTVPLDSQQAREIIIDILAETLSEHAQRRHPTSPRKKPGNDPGD